MDENTVIEKIIALGATAVERAVVGDALRAGAKAACVSSDAVALSSDKGVICLARRADDAITAVGAIEGRKTKAPLPSTAREEACSEPGVVYGYLEAMPALPTSAYDIKRLAPSLAGVVAQRAGVSAELADRLMRGAGVYGAIASGKLKGFVGTDEMGAIDLLCVFDYEKATEIRVELIKFMTTLVMTGGKTPFAIVKAAELFDVFEQCGYTRGGLYACVV